MMDKERSLGIGNYLKHIFVTLISNIGKWRVQTITASHEQGLKLGIN